MKKFLVVGAMMLGFGVISNAKAERHVLTYDPCGEQRWAILRDGTCSEVVFDRTCNAWFNHHESHLWQVTPTPNQDCHHGINENENMSRVDCGDTGGGCYVPPPPPPPPSRKECMLPEVDYATIDANCHYRMNKK
jgi:hypothetical protein